jgi:hypothetical protein
VLDHVVVGHDAWVDLRDRALASTGRSGRALRRLQRAAGLSVNTVVPG